MYSQPGRKRKASTQLTIAELFRRTNGRSALVEDEVPPSCSKSAELPEVSVVADHHPESTDTSSVPSAIPLNDIGEKFDPVLARWISPPSRLDTEEKRRLVDHLFIPGPKHDFPVHAGKDGRNRRFRHQWLADHPWLAYSAKCDGAFCVSCVLFPSCSDQGQLVASPLVNFKKATTLFDKHRQQRAHLDSVAKLAQFKLVAASGRADVNDQLIDAGALQARENEEKLKSILDCVIFCGKQNIPLRGHRNEVVQISGNEAESAEELSLFPKDKGNAGNFLALLEFRAKAGDASVVRDFHLQARGTGHRINYCSAKSQNELIDCCGEYVRENILTSVRSAPFFSVLADEATDSSNMEQMPLVVRYVEDFQVREDFLGFVSCDTGLTGQALATKILDALESWNLDPIKCRGQGYDGAANMAGRLNGCAAIIQRSYPKALYYHCSSHALNLCVMATSKISSVSNMWTVLREVSMFFDNSPRRQQQLESTISETTDESKKRKLVSLCRTRWVQRHAALVTFSELFPAVVTTFELIANDRGSWNADTCGMASSLLRSITDFQFLSTFVVVSNIMLYMQGLCVSLQQKSLDVLRAYKQVANVQATLEKVRRTVEQYHATWWQETVDMAASVNVEPSAPRTCSRQRGRDNVPAATPEEYFRRAVSVPFLDELLAQFAQRFGSLQQKVCKGLSLLPSVLLANPEQAKTDALSFAKEVSDDLPADSSVASFRAELDIFHSVVSKMPREDLPNDPIDCAKLASESLCPALTTILILLATLPVTTCSCERSVSSLRRLKTYLRSTMGEDRLSGLALLHSHYGMKVEKDEVLKIFFRRAPRRIRSSHAD